MEVNKSFWIENFEGKHFKEFKELENDIKTDVCIIGGGITGISTAYYLAKKGIEATILEKDTIASKTTGNTTGKITAQHGSFYKYLIENNGFKYTKKYAEANLDALENIKEIINTENIECDFEEKDAIIYSKNPENYYWLQKEAEVYEEIGVNVDFIQKINLPIMIQGGIRLRNQAQFNPIKYINGICNVITKNKINIYEKSKVVDYKKIKNKFVISVETVNGKYRVISNKLVIATRYPIFDFPGMYFIKNYQELEYVMCVKVKENLDNMNMYLEIDNPSISYRTVLKNNERYLLIAGNGAKTGEKVGKNEYSILEENLSKVFGKYSVLNKWVAEDVISLDKIPYIGRYSKFEKNMYVATAYKKWGMTTSNIAAKIISDRIANEKSKYIDLFDSTRVRPIKNIKEMKNMIGTTVHYLTCKEKGDKVCSHLGCKTVYNETTNTWDCPCHGSRYEKNGKLIDGPSKENLKDK